MLSGNSLTVGGSETLTTYDLTTTGTLTSGGSSTYNVEHNWANSGTFTSATSTVNLTGGDASTQTVSGSTTFNNLVISTNTNSAGRAVTFTAGTTQTVSGTWTVTGYSGKVITLQSSTTSAWTINPTAASVTYADISYSTNSGTSFCATYSTNSNNNTGWNIAAGSTCPLNGSSASSFQRKTWYDGTRFWRSYQDTDNDRIVFEYSTDGTNWTEDSSARIDTNTNDFSVQADSSNAYIAYKTGAVTNEDNLVQSNLVGFWKMDESSWNGTTDEAADASGNSHAGTAQGNATTTSSGKFNYAGTFDGTGDFVQVADHADLDITGDFTLSAWIARAGGTNGYIISKTNDSADGGYALLHGNSGEVYCRTNNGTSSTDSYTDTGYVNSDSAWHHVVAVRTGTSCRVWIDGIDVTSVTNTHTTLTANSNNLAIGSSPGGSAQFNGKIDDARVYNRALSTSEIQALNSPGYDIEVRKASSYPGAGFSWGNPTVAYNGSSSTDYYEYPSISQDTNSKIWTTAHYYSTGSVADQQVAANDDDGADVAGSGSFHTVGDPDGWDVTTNIATGGRDYSDNAITTGYRWTNVGIPQKATISSASFDIYDPWGGNYLSNMKTLVYGAKTSALDTFSSSNLPRSVTKTTASATWDSTSDGTGHTWYSGSTGYIPPSITSEVQEVVDQSDWTKISPFGLLITDNGSSNGWWWAASTFEDNSGTSAKFSASWTASQMKAIQSTSANDISAWNTETILDQSTNTNKYGTIVPRTSGAMMAVWMDGTAIESDTYNGSVWSGTPTSVATGVTGLTTTLSATADASGNVHLVYIDSSNHTVYQEYTSAWQTAVTLDSNSGNAYPTITYNTTSTDVYAFWIRSNHIYYKKGVSTYASGNWDASATDWQTTGTNTYSTSNYNGANKIFVEWMTGTNISWAQLSLASNTVPSAPSALYVNERETTAQSGSTNPVAVGDATPAFSSVYEDTDSGDIANKYEVIVYSDMSCTAQVWDSGSAGTSMTNCTQGNRCSDISFGGTALPFDGTKYYWKIKYWDDEPSEGSYSDCTANFTMLSPDDQTRNGNYFYNNQIERKFSW